MDKNLQSIISAIINDDVETASSELHEYINIKTRKIIESDNDDEYKEKEESDDEEKEECICDDKEKEESDDEEKEEYKSDNDDE